MVRVHPAVPQKSLKRFQSLGSISSRRLGILAGLAAFKSWAFTRMPRLGAA
jgi:hypothetical protein